MSSKVAIRREPDDREAALLVRVEPRQVQVRGHAGREAQEAEHHVLDPVPHVRLAEGVALDRLLLGQAQHHRDVVRAERPERVLVGAQLAEVQPVAVDVVDVAELARVHELLQPHEPGVVLEQVADHQRPPARPRPRPPRPRRRPPTARAASPRTRACRPRARAGPARRAWARAWRSPRRRAPDRRAAPRTRRWRGPRERRADALEPLGVPVADPGQARVRAARRSCARGSGPSSRAPRLRPRRSRRRPSRRRPPPRRRPARALSSGPIGSARIVRASSSVAGSSAAGEGAHRRLPVRGRAVVAARADPALAEGRGQLVGALGARHVEVVHVLGARPSGAAA